MGLGGKGLCVWDGVNDAANTRARWDRTPKQLRVTVITQAKFPSMVYVNVWVCMCVCVYVCCMHVRHTLNCEGIDGCSCSLC